MYDSIESINLEIHKFFGDNLISLVVFGSSQKKQNFKITSDLDYIIILKHLQDPQSKVSRDLKNTLGRPFPLVAFNIYETDHFLQILKHNPWLALSISLGYKIYLDECNFFGENITNIIKKIKNTKIGHLAWQFDNSIASTELLEYYAKKSNDYLEASGILVKNTNTAHIACELLLSSIHSFMIKHLMQKKIYITSGEITQLFFNIFSGILPIELRSELLMLEQNNTTKYSFDFEQGGDMLFSKKLINDPVIFFNNGVSSFTKLKTLMNSMI